MELKDFISQTLVHIIEGVKDAQEKARKLEGIVNPTMNDFSKNVNLKYVGFRGYNDDQRVIYPVEFDVAISTGKSSGKKGGAGLSFGSIHVGGHKESQSSQSQDAQVKFVVPILLPYDSQGFQARPSDAAEIMPSESSQITEKY